METFAMVFTAPDGTKYGVDNPYDEKIVTYLLDDEGRPSFGADTSDTQNWDKFYRLGWTKEELHQGYLNAWGEWVTELLAHNAFCDYED